MDAGFELFEPAVQAPPAAASDRPPRRARRAAAVQPECFATNRYFDRDHGKDAAKLLPGEYFATSQDMLLVTVLGSCVAACIRDRVRGIGGMNHFMLPDGEQGGLAGGAARYGTYAMEILVNHLMKLGAQRDLLEAKVFGGGNVIEGMTQANIGGKNAEFVRRFLRTEGIRVVAEDLEDVWPRKVYFFPANGRVLVKKLRALRNGTILEREFDYRRRLVTGPGGGEVELFNNN